MPPPRCAVPALVRSRAEGRTFWHHGGRARDGFRYCVLRARRSDRPRREPRAARRRQPALSNTGLSPKRYRSGVTLPMASTMTSAIGADASFGRKNTEPGMVTTYVCGHASSVLRSSSVNPPSPFSAWTTQVGTSARQSRSARRSCRCSQPTYSRNPCTCSFGTFLRKSSCSSRLRPAGSRCA